VEMQRGPGAAQCEAEARHGGRRMGGTRRSRGATRGRWCGAMQLAAERARCTHVGASEAEENGSKEENRSSKNGCSVEDSLISDFSFPLDHNAPTLA
jgi:hypothetical protein